MDDVDIISKNICGTSIGIIIIIIIDRLESFTKKSYRHTTCIGVPLYRTIFFFSQRNLSKICRHFYLSLAARRIIVVIDNSAFSAIVIARLFCAQLNNIPSSSRIRVWIINFTWFVMRYFIPRHDNSIYHLKLNAWACMAHNKYIILCMRILIWFWTSYRTGND